MSEQKFSGANELDDLDDDDFFEPFPVGPPDNPIPTCPHNIWMQTRCHDCTRAVGLVCLCVGWVTGITFWLYAWTPFMEWVTP